jgi:redox-sensitive bicupin YhaK (pirin superfamily)
VLDLVIEARRKDLGGGLEVGRVLPFARRRMVGPFIFLDHMGPADFAPGQGVAVRPHPHIGLATVTYLFTGEIMHRDSLGSTQPIRPGEVNWMTAGRGIVHSERTEPNLLANGTSLHGLQTWVALPTEHEETAPTFAHYGATLLPTFDEAGARGTVIAGQVYGLKSPIATFSPLFYVELKLAPGARFALPDGEDERAAYVIEGSVSAEGATHGAGHLLVFGPGEAVIATDTGAHVMLLGGAAVGPRHIWWNFVSSSSPRIEQARADWAAGRMRLPPDDDKEFIPAPTDAIAPVHYP